MSDQISSNNSKKGSLGQFILGKTLGEGTFGRVKIATHITTGEKVNFINNNIFNKNLKE